jgi:dTDP-glucose pyrophosphorylase
MRAVILAAGKSQRFRDAGYLQPKPFIKIDYRGLIQTMLDHVICTIPLHIPVSVAIPKGYLAHTTKAVAHHTIGYHEIEKTTGPADTALQMMLHYGSEAILFMDADVINFTNDLHRLTTITSCGVLVSQSSNPSFSYVDRLGAFHRVVEKTKISDWAVRGAYYFPKEVMEQFVTGLGSVILRNSEPYLSHVFTHMDTKYSVKTTYAPLEWGTPRDVKLSGAHIVRDGTSIDYHKMALQTRQGTTPSITN